MLALGIIEEVTVPSDWCAPMVPVEKENKEQVRVCVDLKCLNWAVKQEKNNLPTLVPSWLELKCSLPSTPPADFGRSPWMLPTKS